MPLPDKEAQSVRQRKLDRRRAGSSEASVQKQATQISSSRVNKLAGFAEVMGLQITASLSAAVPKFVGYEVNPAGERRIRDIWQGLTPVARTTKLMFAESQPIRSSCARTRKERAR